MRSTSQRPAVHQYNSLNLRRTVAGEMARIVRTSSPDVSREQARYRRIMDLNSAGALETDSHVPHVGSAASYSAERITKFRPMPHTWPRKLEPLPGRVNGYHQFPPTSPPYEHIEQDIMFRNSNSSESNDKSGTSTPDITTDENTSDDVFSHRPEKDSWSIATAMVAALAPISLPKSNEDDQDTAETLITSVVATATAVTLTPQNDIKARRLKKLLPIPNDETKLN